MTIAAGPRARFGRRLLFLLCALVLWPSSGRAQEAAADTEPGVAFSLSSSETFTTRDAPVFHLTFQHLTRLDFRVYKVRDALAFFAALRDPHQLGSEDPLLPREQSWIERLVAWKSSQRRTIRSFVRDQVSPAYRAERRAAQDRQEVARRVTLNQATFAQVPLLNPDQLVTSWRELLPDLRDPEYRRLPLDVREPGVYLVEAVHDHLRAYTIVVVSDVGIVTKTAPGQALVFAADRFSGEPRRECEVQLLINQQVAGEGRTDGDGVVRLAMPTDTDVEATTALARCDGQVAVTDPGQWSMSAPARQLVGYVYTDKPIYRPGHDVHIKAVLRWRADDALQRFAEPEAELSVRDVNDKVVFRRALTADRFGTVQASFTMPPAAALGYYSIRVSSGEHQAHGAFEVQEYRRPEFEVLLSPASRFVVQGNDAVATVQARYYFGQPVANARVRYVVNQQPYYSPLGWSDDGGGEEGRTYWFGGDQRLEGELRLDAEGRGEIRVPLPPDDEGRDYSARIEAQVTDAGSREVSGNTIVHATYGSFLLTARVDGYVFRPSQTMASSVRAVDYTGTAQPGVAVRVVLERLSYPDGSYAAPTRTMVSESTVTTGADGSAPATFTLPADGGSYQVRAMAAAGDREISATAWLWVAGPSDIGVSDGDRYLELLADRRSYAPGDTARLVVRGDPLSGPVLATKEGQQVTWHQLMRVAGGAAIEVPIDEGDVGDIYVNIAFLRDGRLYRAERRLSVPAASKTLQIAITADRAVARPQEPGVFSVVVTDAAGAPVEAQVSLGVIDEAVYAVRADDTPDPVRFFHRREYSRVNTAFSRDYYFTGYSGSERLRLTSRRRRPFTLADFKGDQPAQPQVRKEFPDAIYWIGDLVTDASGRARVAIRYPDALTTWRLTARAVTEDTKAGAAVAHTTTTKDLIVRIVTPRFLTEGDEVVLPTIVHNYREDAKATTLTFAADGLAPVSAGPSSTDGLVDSGGERRDDWRLRAPAVGTAVVTATARTDTDTDAVELPIPVVPYGLHREDGASGTLAGAATHAMDLTIPASANPAARTISVSLAPSMAGSLLGALDYLTSFPYGCTEQTLSSFVPNLMVARTMAQLKLSPTQQLTLLDRQVATGMRRLADYQHDDGGWGWWKTDDNHPFMTAYALFGLAEARAAGYAVDESRVERGAQALAAMHEATPDLVPDLQAYIAYALMRAMPDAAIGNYTHAAAIETLWGARSRMSAYGRALLLLVLDAAGDRRGDELATALAREAQTRGELSWWVSERDPLLFDVADTSVEATAMAVQALARRDPSQPLLDRAVRWLLLNRRGGYWSSTKQTAFALYGLNAVLQARGETPQTFDVDVFVNGAPAGTHTFTPASLTAPDPVTVSAPARDGVNSVRLVKRGGGTLYWSARASYFDVRGAEARSGSRELAISRRYARLVPVRQGERIVYREEPFDGRIAVGDVLSVRLVVAGAKDWRYLMIEDPLPAGVEALQDTTAYPMEREEQWRWWWGSHTEYRDQRTVFFQEHFDGRAEYVYLVKAIAAGEFRASPAQVSPMYVPDAAASSDPQTVGVALATPRGGR